ncbi:DUF4079 domain-containing protein [Synechococcus sp. PCC 6312]|uniref:DUF4079 domain-containing protein n=1 Tax=Synechococcus sp. (strain ATCC 27167 / PCC 6312) TaxID=195253 RepID=UPI00029F009B|nr:DUF4079 domain-containing protein [Synechococcus sp. PCC 6312]AFY61983.1 hypothetical protein Syn6312_2921 [Synechococcus sp. PCC 6312]
MPFLIAKINLPSFLWLWRIAAWSMGGVLCCYFLLTFSGLGLSYTRLKKIKRPNGLRFTHLIFGTGLVGLIFLLLIIGLMGTYGYYGSLGHSWHLVAGLIVVALGVGSAISALQIHPQRAWARPLHLTLNGLLLIALGVVAWTGWAVVQKYLPERWWL